MDSLLHFSEGHSDTSGGGALVSILMTVLLIGLMAKKGEGILSSIYRSVPVSLRASVVQRFEWIYREDLKT